MLSIANISGGKSEYYLGQSVSKGGYYLGDGAQSRWGGGAKDALGLPDGPVQPKDFDRIYDGHVPDGRLGHPAKDGSWDRDPGRDLTFSAPKSGSILAQGEHREAVLAAHDISVDKAMQVAEDKFAKTRISGKETGDQKIVWAAFTEETSRAGDMDLHSHVVVFNNALGEDGKFRSLDNRELYDRAYLLGQIYRAELKQEMKKLGFTMEPAGKHGLWEIKEVPKGVREQFSKRRQAILEKITPANDTPKGRETLAILTRPVKKYLPRTELMKSWSQQLKTLGTSFDQLSKPANDMSRQNRFEPSKWTADQAVSETMSIRSETQSYSDRYELIRDIMSRTHCDHTFDELESAIDKAVSQEKLALSRDGGYLTTPQTLRREDLAVDALKAGHLQSGPLVKEGDLQTALDASTLTVQQKAACELIGLDHSRPVRIDGLAGVGKTWALRTVVPLIKQSGYKVIGIAPTGAATDELADTGVFDKTMTTQLYDLQPEGDNKTVLIVDETSMHGTNQILSLARFANSKNMPRIVFIGDPRQMAGVSAGNPHELLGRAGVRTVRLDEIKRQESARHREGILQLNLGRLKEAFSTLRPEIQQVSADQMTSRAIDAWKTTKDPLTPIIVQTNRQKNEINAAIQSEQARLNPDAKQSTIKTWRPVYASDTEKRFVSTYKDVSHIRFNRDYKRLNIKRGDIFKLKDINANKAELTLSKNGKSRTFRPAALKMGKGSIELYRQTDTRLREGDRIRFTRSDKSQKLLNNDYGKVKSVNGDQITFELDRGRSLTLGPKDTAIRHVDHAWANTTHAFQGKTVDHAIVVMPSRRSPLTTLESLYTGASRHRHSLTIITDDAKRLQRSISKNLDLQDLKTKIRFPDQEKAKQTKLQERTSQIGDPAIRSKTDETARDRTRNKALEHERIRSQERQPRDRAREITHSRGDFGR